MVTFFSMRIFTVSAILRKAKWSKSFKPKLTLTGDWLKDAGFGVGEKVTVQISANQLIITKI